AQRDGADPADQQQHDDRQRVQPEVEDEAEVGGPGDLLGEDGPGVGQGPDRGRGGERGRGDRYEALAPPERTGNSEGDDGVTQDQRHHAAYRPPQGTTNPDERTGDLPGRHPRNGVPGRTGGGSPRL